MSWDYWADLKVSLLSYSRILGTSLAHLRSGYWLEEGLFKA